MTSVRVVIVNWNHHDGLVACVRSLFAGTVVADTVVVVDNDPEGRGTTVLRETALPARVLVPDRNLGFAAGCNHGAQGATEAWLLFLNPDTVVEPECLERLVEAGEADPRRGVVGAQVLMADGATTNAGANPLHITGLSWSGRLGEPPEEGPPRSCMLVSGAALMIRRDLFDRLGGFTAEYFLYHEDVDLCWRARLLGADVVLCPRARVRHDYHFTKHRKWFYMERNRLLTVLANYERRTLVALAPLLVLTELAITLAAVGGGWWGEKRAAYLDVVRRRRRLLTRRREIQATRTVTDAELWPLLSGAVASAVLDTPLLRVANPVLAAWKTAVGAGLERTRRPIR